MKDKINAKYKTCSHVDFIRLKVESKEQLSSCYIKQLEVKYD
ncbi:MAG: hypothetical protein ACE5KE_03890 [Methanosarcinales archaeon]